jgi:hypothetical protein
MKKCGKCMYSTLALILVTSFTKVVSFTTLPLYLREKNPQYPAERRLRSLQGRSGSCGE